jgi:hypothetical protein
MKNLIAHPLVVLRLALLISLIIGQVVVVGAPAKPAHALTIITQWTFEVQLVQLSQALAQARPR